MLMTLMVSLTATNLQKQQSDIANLPIKKIKYILQTINTKEDENRIVKKKRCDKWKTK